MKEVIMRVASFSADYPKAPIYVADLVRCKECKWYEPLDSTRPYDCSRGLAEVTIDDFCSYGEREDE